MNAAKPNVVILGGGVAGLAAARALEAYGVTVDVVEKGSRIGGHALRWACMATDTCQYCGACLSAELADQVLGAPHATIHLNTTLEKLEKQASGFTVVLKGASPKTIEADAVLVATGMTPFDPSAISDLGYADFDQVVTTADLNGILQQDRLGEILPDTPSPSIAFIQCVGSRDRQSGRDYCSQVCCKTAVRQVNKILHQIPQAEITLFHIDLQVIGKAFRSQAAAIQPHVHLHQGVPAKIWNDRQAGKVSIIQEDPATGSRTAQHFDLIVLAVGILPSAQIQQIVDQLGVLAGVSTDDWGFFSGPDSLLAPGVYTAGTARGPADILTAKEQGMVAAHRMAADLGWLQAADARPGVVVLGGGRDAVATAGALADSGYAVTLLDNNPEGAPAVDGIDYFTGAKLSSVSGTAGRFRISFNADGDSQTTDAAAIIAAGGIQTEPLPAVEKMVSLSRYLDDLEGKRLGPVGTVVFWLDRHGPEWKDNSRQCLQQAADWVAQGRRAIVIMEKMLVHGLQGQRLYDQARHAGVRFMRVDGPDQVRVTPGDTGVVLQINESTLPGVEVTLEADLLVVPGNVKPPASATAISQVLRQPQDPEGFLQSANVRHRPVGSPRRGIFFVGACHDEADEADLQSEIEAVKASLARLTRGYEPLEPPAIIDEGKCGRCLTCYRACPHGAVVIRNEVQPLIVSEVCVGCGICVSSCPARAINAAPRAEIPAVSPTEGGTVVFACRRSGALAAKAAGVETPNAQIVEVRCAGQIDEQTLLQPLLEGAEAVVIAACHEGNCRSMVGGRAAAARTAKMAGETGLESALRHHFIAANEPARMTRIITGNGSEKEKSHA